MPQHEIYDPEVGTNLFDQLQTCQRLRPDHRQAYLMLSRIFHKCLDLKTDIPGMRFSGSFAKADYLLKAHKASRKLRAVVNEARVRMKELAKIDEEVLADNFMHDWKAVCQFVALVYKTPVPSLLEIHFPADRKHERREIKTECLRVIVNRWDDTYVYAEADTEDAREVKVFYGGTSAHAVYTDWDWRYLQGLLKAGRQLNIVRPTEKDGVLYAELIVVEPDYLVDISSVAECFENYADSHLVRLIKKVNASANTSAILLGKLASQFLDEALQSETFTYKESIGKFFGSFALDLLCTDLDRDFHEQAIVQQKHIHSLLKEKLPQLLENDAIRINSTDIMVEPSFFSEMLGLQGRMDFLHLDQKVVIEQKSGKGGFPQPGPDTPVQQEKHYVQLLLYMLLLRYNYRAQYEKNGRNLHAFLLYSKYRDGLIGLGFAPQLIFTAMKVRNEIAAAEFDYTQGHIDILGQLTPERLNIKGASGRLWNDYQRKQIEAILQPIHRASPLELAYYYRFLTFIETEHLMAKVGNQTKENSGFADKWHSTLEEKLQAGNIYADLELLQPAVDSRERVDEVTLQFTERPDNDISNFRTGDIVILYPYEEGEEPDARQTMVFRSTIKEIREDTIVLSLRAEQVNAHVFWHRGHRKWAIEHDFFESSFSALYRGMHAFLSAPQARKDLLLLQREPRCDKSLTLRGDYGQFNTLSLKVRQAKDLFLIIGPPGTGKTSYGLMNTLKEELMTPEANILLLSYTNRAVDEICSKLTEEGLDFLRIGSKHSCDENCLPYMLDTKVKTCSNTNALLRLLQSTRIFTGTTSAFSNKTELFKIKKFSLAIIDEASQILEPHLAGILSATAADGTSAIEKLVFIGDHKQLPAVVQQTERESAVDNAQLKAIHLTNCRLSLFERLLRQYRDNPDVVYMLTKQGRMHHDIADFPNYTFYQGKLQVVPLDHQLTVLPSQPASGNGIANLLTTRRIAFVAVTPPENSPSDKVNTHEAQAIAATVLQIYRLYQQDGIPFCPDKAIGIIVPYRNQIAEIRKHIEKSGIDTLRHITIDTVERYQGSQRDYILYGFTIQQYYQLNFLTSHVFEEDGSIIDRKLNVAMTRAREHLVMFGNAELLANNLTFYKLMAFIRHRHGYVQTDLTSYTEGNFDVEERTSDLDFGQVNYALEQPLADAFNQLVTAPVRQDARTQWPEVILGRDLHANLEAIGYGRTSQDHPHHIPAPVLTPQEQVLVYCHYVMRLHYSCHETMLTHIAPWLRTHIHEREGRVHMVDIGCGPATCGLAFAGRWLDEVPGMRYTGIDPSAAMREKGEALLTGVFSNRLHHRLLPSWEELEKEWPASEHEAPSLIVFNFSFFFSILSAQFTEQLAARIAHLMQSHPHHRYVFLVQYAICDRQLNAYNVFGHVLQPYVTPCRSTDCILPLSLHGHTCEYPFCYEILTNRTPQTSPSEVARYTPS